MTDLVSRLRKEGERCDAEACFTAADEITRLRAELAAKTDWRPIATAPTDRWVLVWRPHSTVPFLARYDAEYAAFEDTFGDHVYHVTHWMSLPLPPEESK